MLFCTLLLFKMNWGNVLKILRLSDFNIVYDINSVTSARSSRSSAVSLFDRVHMTSYSPFIETVHLSCITFDM